MQLYVIIIIDNKWPIDNNICNTCMAFNNNGFDSFRKYDMEEILSVWYLKRYRNDKIVCYNDIEELKVDYLKTESRYGFRHNDKHTIVSLRKYVKVGDNNDLRKILWTLVKRYGLKINLKDISGFMRKDDEVIIYKNNMKAGSIKMLKEGGPKCLS